jgi:hypothetical protein
MGAAGPAGGAAGAGRARELKGLIRTARYTLRRLALLNLTRSALAALPSEVSLSQQREHSAPWTPLLLAPHAWQVSGCQGVPAFWRAYQRRWRSALVGSGISRVDGTGPTRRRWLAQASI